MSEKPWGGVFDQATDRRVEEFTESVSFDRRLYAQDIEGSIAHAQMLAKVGLITPTNAGKLSRLCTKSAKKSSRAASRSAPNWKTSTCTSSGR